MFESLQHRNFRLLWWGLLVSFTGSNMQSAAILWHISLLVPADRRALALGLVGLVRIGPIIVFSLVSGVAADALDRRKLMLVTQTLMTASSGALAILTLQGLSTVWPIYALAAFGSAAGAFDLPARQSMVPNLVPVERLPNAISLNTTMVQIASVGGPAIGGFVIATKGVGWAYAANAVSYLFVIGALLMMRADQGPANESPAKAGHYDSHADLSAEAPGAKAEAGRDDGRPGAEDTRNGKRGDFSFKAALEGVAFVFRAPLIRSTMLLDFFATLFSSATALLPIFAQDILHVGPQGYGWLYAAPAAGAVLASLVMVRAVDWIEERGTVLIGAVMVYGLATVAFGVSRSFWLTFGCLGITGAADTVSMVFRNLIRQIETPDRLRGRMTGVNMVFFMGGPQLGELEAGIVANWFGAVVSVVTGGIGCLAATAWIAASTPALRRYRRTQ